MSWGREGSCASKFLRVLVGRLERGEGGSYTQGFKISRGLIKGKVRLQVNQNLNIEWV